MSPAARCLLTNVALVVVPASAAVVVASQLRPVSVPEPVPTCEVDEAVSPFTGRCAAEGSDSWFGCGDVCGAPTTKWTVDRIEATDTGDSLLVLETPDGLLTLPMSMLPGVHREGLRLEFFVKAPDQDDARDLRAGLPSGPDFDLTIPEGL